MLQIFSGMPLATTSLISTLSFFCSTFLVPLGGYLSDRVGRKVCLRWSAMGFVLLSYPLFMVIAQGSIYYFIAAQVVFVLLAAVYQGTITATVFEMLPTEVRYSVVAVGYNISYSIFGGTAPLVATYIVNITGNKSAPGLYLALGAFIAFLAVSKIQKTLSQNLT